MATDEDVEKQRNTLKELRAQLENARSSGGEKQNELSNEIAITQMQAEEARLRAAIESEKQASLVREQKAGASAPLEAAKEDMKIAVAQQKAAHEAATANKTSSRSASTEKNDEKDKEN